MALWQRRLKGVVQAGHSAADMGVLQQRFTGVYDNLHMLDTGTQKLDMHVWKRWTTASRTSTIAA